MRPLRRIRKVLMLDEPTTTHHTWTKEPGRTWSVFTGRTQGHDGAMREIQVWCATSGVEPGWVDVSYFELDGITPVSFIEGAVAPRPITFLFAHRAGD